MPCKVYVSAPHRVGPLSVTGCVSVCWDWDESLCFLGSSVYRKHPWQPMALGVPNFTMTWSAAGQQHMTQRSRAPWLDVVCEFSSMRMLWAHEPVCPVEQVFVQCCCGVSSIRLGYHPCYSGCYPPPFSTPAPSLCPCST